MEGADVWRAARRHPVAALAVAAVAVMLAALLMKVDGDRTQRFMDSYQPVHDAIAARDDWRDYKTANGLEQ